MQITLLKEIASTIAGPEATKIVDILYSKKNVNEFDVAKKLNLTINQTRNLLYKLLDEGLTSFIRKKDRKKGGWYIYFWSLNSGRGMTKLKESLEKEIKSLNEQIARRNSQRFFVCKMCGREYNEEEALLGNYTCPECGETMDLKDSTADIENIKKEIAKRERVLVEVSKEVFEIAKLEGRAIARKNRAEAKKKAKERALRKKAKEREVKKVLKEKEKKKKVRMLAKKKHKSGKKPSKKLVRKMVRGRVRGGTTKKWFDIWS